MREQLIIVNNLNQPTANRDLICNGKATTVAVPPEIQFDGY